MCPDSFRVFVRSIVQIRVKITNLGGDRQPGCCAPRLDLSFEAGERPWAGVVVHRRESATPSRLKCKFCESLRYRVPGPMSGRLEHLQVCLPKANVITNLTKPSICSKNSCHSVPITVVSWWFTIDLYLQLPCHDWSLSLSG